jgi:hypothetical protein
MFKRFYVLRLCRMPVPEMSCIRILLFTLRLHLQNATLEEEKQGLERDSAALQKALQERDVAIQDMQLRADGLRARLHDLESALPSDRQQSAQVFPLHPCFSWACTKTHWFC